MKKKKGKFSKMNTQLTQLIKTIGIPGIVKGDGSAHINSSLRQLAQKNKIGLLYCSACNYQDENLTARHELLMRTLGEVSDLFNKNSVDYAVFKTVKPFKTTPSDIDVIVSDSALTHASSVLKDAGYKVLAEDSYSATMSKNMIVDLQLQPSVSNLPYLDKDYLMNSRTRRTVNGIEFYGLSDEAEITVVACHSVYKELMFTLNDYYTITILAQRVQINDILRAAQITKNENVFKIIMGLCQQITERAFGTTDLRVCETSRQLGLEVTDVENMPVKFPLSLVVKLLLSKATRDNLVRTNVVPAFIKSISAKQISRLVSHLGKDTY